MDERLRWDRVWIAASFLAIAIGLYFAFVYTPIDASGITQKIFYFHVPAAIVSFLAFAVCCVASIAYLRTRSNRWDHIALANAELGVFLSWLVLTTGPIWAHRAWGQAWVWDARLTTTLILFLIYVAYLLLRRSVSSPERAKVLAAIVGIVGFIDVPIVYMANQWWETTHPPPMIMKGDGLDTPTRIAFLVCLAAYVVLYIALARLRTESIRLDEETQELSAHWRRRLSQETL